MNRDNVDAEYLAAPKAWDARSIARFMIVLGPTSSAFDICTFLLNWYVHPAQIISSLFCSPFIVDALA
jgi:P-type Mg2+ transporter